MICPFKKKIFEHLLVSDIMLSTMGITVSSVDTIYAFKEDSPSGESQENHKLSDTHNIRS